MMEKNMPGEENKEIRDDKAAKMERIRELVPILNRAAQAYYAEDVEVMSNLEYDRLYDELVRLEEETGFVLAGSPTVKVGYEAVDFLPKERPAKVCKKPNHTLTSDAIYKRNWNNLKQLFRGTC